MPITSIDSYPAVMADFGLHWGQVNDSLTGGGGTALLLPAGFMLAQFLTLRDSIVTGLSNHQDLVNDYELGLADRDSQRANMRERIVNFRQTCQSQLPGARYLRALPDTPRDRASEGKFLAALDDVASLWAKINADNGIAGFTPPLLLRGGYTLAGFNTDVAALRTDYQSLATAERELKLAREDRDRLLADAYERMKQYRARVEAEFLETDPLFQSLPDLSPNPGSTPDAVVLSAFWDGALSLAQLSWTESTDPNLQVYQVRACLGPTWDEAQASVIANYAPTTLSTGITTGLVNPGDQTTFKIFVILSTGNQAGSNAVTVTRT